jgi:hypothetical protein
MSLRYSDVYMCIYARCAIRKLILILSLLAKSQSLHFCGNDHKRTYNFLSTVSETKKHGLSFMIHPSIFPSLREYKVICKAKSGRLWHDSQNISTNIKFLDEPPTLRMMNRTQVGFRMFPIPNVTSSDASRTLPAGSSFFFRLKKSAEQVRTSISSTRRKEKIFVNSTEYLDSLVKQGLHVSDFEIRGRSQPWRQNERGALLSNLSFEGRGDGRKSQLKHSVLEAIWQRARIGSKPGQRTDNFKIGLAIEGEHYQFYFILLTITAFGNMKVEDCADARLLEWQVRSCTLVCLIHLILCLDHQLAQ